MYFHNPCIFCFDDLKFEHFPPFFLYCIAPFAICVFVKAKDFDVLATHIHKKWTAYNKLLQSILHTIALRIPATTMLFSQFGSELSHLYVHPGFSREAPAFEFQVQAKSEVTASVGSDYTILAALEHLLGSGVSRGKRLEIAC